MKVNFKLLAELDRNARQPETVLARKLRMSKQRVHYQLRNLEREGIVEQYYALINTNILGYTSYYAYIKFKEASPDDEKRILEMIKKERFVGWLVHCTGTWDMIVLIYSKTVSDFEENLSLVLHHCGTFLQDFLFTIAREQKHIQYPFLSRTYSVLPTKVSPAVQFGNVDERVLRAIASSNARSSILELSRKKKIPAHILRYGLRSLEKRGVIQGYKPRLNVQKLGYQWYLVLLTMKNATVKEKEKVSSSCAQQKNVYYVTRVIGKYDLMLDVHVKDSGELRLLIEELKTRAGSFLNALETQTIYKEEKISYFPE